jgi:hypothetical protein
MLAFAGKKWMVYVWLAFLMAGWMVPAWRWLRRKRAAGWPVADGRIESVEVRKPNFSFTTRRGYYVAELGYSYSVAGTLNSGRYKRDFPTERDIHERSLIAGVVAIVLGLFGTAWYAFLFGIWKGGD